MGKRKSWSDKLHSAKPPHVVVLEKPYAGVPAGATLFIASPLLIKAYLEQVPYGETRLVTAMRADMAAANDAVATCPTSTGIYLRVVAEAAWEEHQAGKATDAITPFWRVIDPESDLAKRLECGPEFVATMRVAETRSRQDVAA